MPARTTGRKRRPSRRITRRGIKRRAKGRARPMRSLRTSYRGVPNQYRFVREMASESIDLHSYLKAGNTAGVMTVPGVAVNDLTNFQADYANLFTNYKVDKIEVEFRPIWDTVEPNPGGYFPELTLTLINTKWHINAIAYGATDVQARQTVSQIQMKKRIPYSSKRGFKLVTYKPRMYAAVQTDFSGGTEVSSIPARWMNISSSGDTEHTMNQDVFFERNDQGAISASHYRFLRIVRVHFRTSAVH